MMQLLNLMSNTLIHNKKIVVLLLILLGPLYGGPDSSEPINQALSAFDQAIIDLYFNHPELIEPPSQQLHSEQLSNSYVDYFLKNKKKFLQLLIDCSALGYCCYGINHTYSKNYNNSAQLTIFTLKIERALEYLCPSIIRTMPAHIGFFMQTVELVLKIYVLKTALKIAVYLLV